MVYIVSIYVEQWNINKFCIMWDIPGTGTFSKEEKAKVQEKEKEGEKK